MGTQQSTGQSASASRVVAFFVGGASGAALASILIISVYMATRS